MTTTALTIPAYAKNAVMVAGQKTALTEAASGGVGGKAEFPHISIEAGRWRLIDVDGEERVLNTFEISFAVVSINPNVSKAWYKDKFVPGGERGAPDCYSDNGQVPYPDSDLIQSQQCQTCDKNVWGSDVNPQNGNKLKACKDTKHISLMFLNPENLALDEPEVYSQRLSAMSMINFSNFAKDVAAQGGALDYIVIKAEFDTKASFPLINYSVIRNMTEEEYNAVAKVRDSERAPRAAGATQKVIPILAERVQHIALREEVQGIAGPSGEMTQAQVDQARAAEAARAERIAAAKAADAKVQAENAAIDARRMQERAQQLAAAAPAPAETEKQRKARLAREAFEQAQRELDMEDTSNPDHPAAGSDATNVTKITDVEPKVRQRSPVNVTQPETASSEMEDLLSAAMDRG